MSESSHAKAKTPLLSDSSYKIVKYVASVVLPSLATLYFALAQIWGLPNTEEVMGTMTALNALFGVLLGVSTKSYNSSDTKYAGDVAFEPVNGDPSVKRMVADLNVHPQVISSMDEVLFRVVEK